MTSRAALGIQPPPQNRIAGGARAAQTRSRPAAQISSALNEARKPASDSTGDEDKQRLAESRDVKPVSALANTNTQPSSTEPSTARSAHSDRQPVNTTPAVLFPPRPGHYNVDGHSQALRPSAEGASSLSRKELRSQSQEPPSESLQLPHHKPVDYYPWSNNHPEDTLSDQTIKSGFQNKSLVTNETNNTALKPSFKPFKDKLATPTLSWLFVSVLEKRQTLGRITGPTSAKPPPRVSLTSSRREAWLQDLSNPTIPLRKLNRTIPFGITGKVLLEQCLSKSIPITRAIWLSKAVGINELRAYKRKGANGPGGVSGELKWIREWTTDVQRFIESTCDLCGQPDFNRKMQYAISLSSHLFAEHLLDQETFVDWLLSSAEKARIERLPLWLLLIQVYWKQLVSNRKRGRRLAQCLLSRLDLALSDPSSDLLTPIVKRMQLLIATLAVKSKGCMILPSVWSQYQRLLGTVVDEMAHPFLSSALEDLNVRNEHLGPPSGASTDDQIRRKLIIELLDNASHETNFDELIEICCNVENDLQMVASTVFQWATSVYRSGSHQVYLATRILRRLYDLGVDIDALVVPLLSGKDSHRFDFTKVLAVTAELVRSSHFSVGRYCQSLIVRGAAGAAQDGSEPDQRLLALLKELPTDDCSERVCILRKLLLREAGLRSTPTDEELRTVEEAKDQLLTDPPMTGRPPLPLDLLDLPVKNMLCNWLTERLTAFDESANENSQYAKESCCSITRCEFYAYRAVIEQLGDRELLGQLLDLSLSSDESEFLTDVIETLEYHLQCFAAIGTLQPLLDKLVERYQILRLKIHLEKSLVSAMNALFATLSSNASMQLQLKNDLAQCHQRAVLAMCSPASDNAVDVLMSDDVDTDDEIDRILSSGTTMDEQIVARVFKRITSRVGECDIPEPSYAVRCGHWFARLRSFDQATFDNLMQEWMTQTMTSSRQTCISMVPALVGCGCSTVASFLQCISYCRAPAKSDRNFCAQLDLDTLEILLLPFSATDATNPEVWYKYKLERQKFVQSSTTTVLNCFQRAIQSCGTCDSESSRARIRVLLQNRNVVDFLKRAAVHSSEQFQNCLCNVPAVESSVVEELNKETILSLFDLDKHLLAGDCSVEVMQLFEIADELSLPMCQLELLRLIPPDTVSKATCAVRSVSKKAIACLQKDLIALCDATTIWKELLSVVGNVHLHQLCNIAEQDLLSSIKTVIRATAEIDTIDDLEASRQAENIIRKSFGILEALSLGTWSPKFSSISESLKWMVDALSLHSGLSAEDVNQSPHIWYAAESIYYILRLSVLLKHSDTPLKLHGSELTSFLSTICTLLGLPALQHFPDLLQFSFDFLIFFSDDLTDDQRTQLSRLEAQRHNSDPRLAFIFGSASSQSSQESWLGLVTSASTPSSGGSSGAPSSTPTSTSASSVTQRFQQQHTPGAPRPMTASSQVQGQQPPARAPTPLGAGRPTGVQAQQKMWNSPVPFPLRRWEVLPDAGGGSAAGAGGNDTSVSLALFGARRVC